MCKTVLVIDKFLKRENLVCSLLRISWSYLLSNIVALFLLLCNLSMSECISASVLGRMAVNVHWCAGWKWLIQVGCPAVECWFCQCLLSSWCLSWKFSFAIFNVIHLTQQDKIQTFCLLLPLVEIFFFGIIVCLQFCQCMFDFYSKIGMSVFVFPVLFLDLLQGLFSFIFFI